MKSFSFLALVCVSVLALTGCETEEDRKLASAQACLDSANSESEADDCVDIVDGLTSEKADLIRCSAHFVAQGFTASRMTEAFSDINEDDEEGAGTNTLLSYMIFDESLTKHTAAKAEKHCANSGVDGMIKLSKAVAVATKIVNLGGVAFDPENPEASLQANIDALIASGSVDDKEEIGDLALDLEETFCSKGSGYEDSDVCKTLDSAIDDGNGDADAIGEALLALLDKN